MIKQLKGHPNTLSLVETEKMNKLMKETFMNGSKITDDEEVLYDEDLERKILNTETFKDLEC